MNLFEEFGQQTQRTLTPAPPRTFDDRLISVVSRLHSPRSIPVLLDAIQSVRNQTVGPIEHWVVTQRFDENEVAQVEKATSCRVLNVVDPSQGDIRSELLNRGIEAAQGRYLAFLDYDDVIYPNAFEVLLKALRDSNAVLAAGKIRQSVGEHRDGKWTETSYSYPFSWGRDRFDVMAQSFLPIHSYLLDRTRIRPELLRFSNQFTVFEDHRFLVPIAALYPFDFSNIDVPIGEYRFRLDNSNTNLMDYTRDPQKRAIWEEAGRRLRTETNPMPCLTTVGEVVDLVYYRKMIGGLSPSSTALIIKIRQALSLLQSSAAGRAFIAFALNCMGVLARVRKLIRR